MPPELYSIIHLVVTVIGMLGAFRLGQLKADDPIIGKKPILSLIDTGEEEKISLPREMVGYGGSDAEEETGDET